MEQIIFKPALYKYSTCKEFAESFSLSERDLILTNEYIYAPYFGKLALPCHVVYQEKYGLGEPSDVMAEAILPTSRYASSQVSSCSHSFFPILSSSCSSYHARKSSGSSCTI